MPLKSGDSRKTISENIAEILDSFEKRGKIGRSRQAGKEAARRQAVAIALNKSRE